MHELNLLQKPVPAKVSFGSEPLMGLEVDLAFMAARAGEPQQVPFAERSEDGRVMEINEVFTPAGRETLLRVLASH